MYIWDMVIALLSIGFIIVTILMVVFIGLWAEVNEVNNRLMAQNEKLKALLKAYADTCKELTYNESIEI